MKQNNTNKPNYMNWDDCIHIEACRRYTTIVERKTGKKISRKCGKDNCTVFCSRKDMRKELEKIQENIEDKKSFIQEEISTQFYGECDNNEMVNYAFSLLNGKGIQEFSNRYLAENK